MIVKEKDFVKRLSQACGTDKIAEVARMLDITYQTAKNYWGGSLPNAEVLLKIRERTGADLNWLLTGEEIEEADEVRIRAITDYLSEQLIVMKAKRGRKKPELQATGNPSVANRRKAK